MSSGPLDVSLRVRLRYQADGARQALGDLDQVNAKARQLGGLSAGRFGQDLRAVGSAAQGAARALGDTTAQAIRLGGITTARLGGELRAVGGAAQGAGRALADTAAQAMRLGGVTTARLGGELRAVGGAAQGAGRALADTAAQAMRLGGITTARLGGELRGIGSAAHGAGRNLAGAGDAANRLGRSGDGARALRRELEATGQEARALQRSLDGVHRHRAATGLGGLERASRHDFANEALMASGLGYGARFGMGGAGAAGLAVGGGIAATAAATARATQNAIKFETAMTEVRKATGGTAEEMAVMERKILQFSRATGVAKTEIAALTAQAGYFNIPREELDDFADLATKASVAFRMSGQEAGKSLGELSNAYGLDRAGRRRAADAINTIGDTAGTSERTVIDFLGRVSGPVQQYKFGFDKAAAIGGTLGGMGVSPDVAATGFNALLGRLGTATKQDKDFQKGLRGIGLNGRQVEKMVQADPAQAMTTVLEKIRSLPADKKPGITADIGGLEYGPAIARMAEGLDKITAALDRVSDPSRYAGSLERTFKIFSSDTQASINRAGTAIDAFAVRIGQKFTPAVRTAADAVERWFNGMNKAMDRRAEAEELAGRMAKGEDLSPQDKARIEANPRLKTDVDKALSFERRRSELESNRRKAETAPGSLPSKEVFRAQREEQFRKWEERRRRVLEGPVSQGDTPSRAPAPETPIPGTGKRSDLAGEARVGLAAYHDTMERGLGRTERMVRDTGRRMRASLSLDAKIDLAGLMRADPGQQIRIERASLDGAGRGALGGGPAAGSFGGGVSAGGADGALPGAAGAPRTAPGRFGGLIPPRAGERFGDGAAGSGRPERTGPAGSGGAHERFGDGGGTRGAARTGEMMGYAMDQLRREGVPEAHVRQSAAHLVGQAHMESGLDPNKSHDGGTGYGIYGARDPSPGRGRRTDMLAWLARNGYARNSAEGQMRYMAHEAMSGRYRQTRRVLMGEGTGDVEQDTNTITREFERPAVINRRSGAVRNAMRAGPGAGPGGERPHVEGAGEPGAGENAQHDPLGGRARRYSSDFGMREHPVRGGRRMHWGQDLAAPAGTPVASMQAGRVSGINRHGDVTVTHGDGSSKTYRHIDPGGIRMGQEVEAGGPLGRLRAHDRRSTGPHLHLEARDPQGRRYDPRAEIEAANRRHNGQVPAVARPGIRNADRPAAPAEEAMRSPRGPVPAEGERGTRSPRFVEPRMLEVRARPAGEAAGGAGRAGGGGGFGNGIVQHFHGGFDAAETARKATLERNREVRRSFARALGDVGRPG